MNFKNMFVSNLCYMIGCVVLGELYTVYFGIINNIIDFWEVSFALFWDSQHTFNSFAYVSIRIYKMKNLMYRCMNEAKNKQNPIMMLSFITILPLSSSKIQLKRLKCTLHIYN